MKAIVTGGAGFIGSHLVEKLATEGIDVVVVDNFEVGREKNYIKRSNTSFVHCDISNQKELLINTLKDADTVYHLAARADVVPSIELPERYFEVNVTGTKNVMEAARINNVKTVVYAASSSCYGIPDEYPTKETAELRPQYPYALTKCLGEQLALHWGKVYNIKVVSVRFFNVYGTRARTSGTYGAVFGVFLAQKIKGLPFTIVGDGEQTRDFTYVSDIANAIMIAGKEGKTGEIYNIGSGETVSINKIVELLDGKSVHIPKRPGEPDCTYADITKITSQTSWKPRVKIEDGIKTMLENIDYWQDAPVWDVSSIANATKSWFKYMS